MDYPEKNIAGTLLLLRKQNGRGIIGNWSLCTFELPGVNMTLEQIEERFSTHMQDTYLGDLNNLTSIAIEGEFNPIVFFLIPTQHVGEVGKHIFTFPVLTE